MVRRVRSSAYAAFEELAATAPEDALHRESLSRLAFALGQFGKKEKETATSLLQRAQRAYPDDFWINYDLARLLELLLIPFPRLADDRERQLLGRCHSRCQSADRDFFLGVTTPDNQTTPNVPTH